MFDYAYGIRSVAEYLARARDEVNRLERLQNEALPDERRSEVASAATHAAETLWHMTDLVFEAPDAEAVNARARVGGKTREDFQKNVRDACPALKLCWELANGGKHFKKKLRAEIEAATVSIVPSVSIALPWKRRAFKRRPKITFPDGRRVRAAEVFRDALGEWERLIRP